MKLGDAGANVSVETVPTGSLSLDILHWDSEECLRDV